MGITNIRAGTTDKLARLRGELAAKREELQRIEESVQRISILHHEIAELEKAIEGGAAFLKYLYPDWEPSKTIARRPNVGKGPFKIGERGKIALGILRDAPRMFCDAALEGALGSGPGNCTFEPLRRPFGICRGLCRVQIGAGVLARQMRFRVGATIAFTCPESACIGENESL
jgi:hypothetical protein